MSSLLTSLQCPSLTHVPSMGHGPCSFGAGDEASPQTRPFPILYPHVSSEADGTGLKTLWDSFLLADQPTSLAPWPLSVMSFVIKIQFVRYMVPLTRPGSLCSLLRLLMGGRDLMLQGQSGPSTVLPHSPRRGRWALASA